MQTLVIPGNFLHPGMKYRLVLNASYRDDGGWSEAFYEFSTNFPPYGGDCSYAVQKGLFNKSTHQVTYLFFNRKKSCTASKKMIYSIQALPFEKHINCENKKHTQADFR